MSDVLNNSFELRKEDDDDFIRKKPIKKKLLKTELSVNSVQY